MIFIYFTAEDIHVSRCFGKKDEIFLVAGFGVGFPYLWFRELPFLPVPFLRAPWPLRLP